MIPGQLCKKTATNSLHYEACGLSGVLGAKKRPLAPTVLHAWEAEAVLFRPRHIDYGANGPMGAQATTEDPVSPNPAPNQTHLHLRSRRSLPHP